MPGLDPGIHWRSWPNLRPELQGAGAEAAGLGDHLVGAFDPLADQPAGIPRVDHFLDLKLVQGADGTARAFDAVVDLRPQGHGVLGLRQLAFVGRFDTALWGNAARVGGGPGDAHGRSVQGCCVVIAGDAKTTPGDDRENWHLDLRESHHPFAALADGAGNLVFEADRETGVIDQIENGHVKDIAQVDMASQLVATIRRQGAAVDVPAVGSNDAEGAAIEAHEAGDLIRAPQRPDFEE